MATISTISEMLRLFREGVASYEPAGLAPDTGSPKDALTNLHRLLGQGLVIQDIWVRPTGTLIIFATGEQYYAPGLRVAAGEETVALAQIAAEAGFGSEEELLDLCRKLPKNYEDKLPSVKPPTPDGEKPAGVRRLEAIKAGAALPWQR